MRVKRKLKPLRIGLGLVVLAIGVFVLDVLRFTGSFHGFDAGFAGSCARVDVAGSAADIRLDRDRGIAYLSVLDRAGVARGEPVNGTVMLLDLNLAQPAPRAAMAHDPQGFRPHGLSLWKRRGEPARLFAISNRADGAQAIEIAAQDADGAFVPVERIEDAAFVHPNAIAATGRRQFYLVNGSGETGRTRAFDALFRRADSTLVYFDGSRSHVLDATLRFPAGLGLSPDGRRLFVGEARAKRLRIYRRDTASGGLTLEEVVPLGSAPDNVDVDADGVVWIAAHPKLLAFFAHQQDPARRAPTQILRFDPRGPRPADGGADARLSQVYGDDGTQISAGSVATHWHNEFLVGALFDPEVLICKPSP
jgi:arylesterase/paraoxonase